MLEGLDEGDIRRWGQEIIDVVKEHVKPQSPKPKTQATSTAEP